MTRQEWETYIAETYSAVLDHPFESFPESTVCRHAVSRKWFALFMNIPREKVERDSKGGNADILNLKCDPILQGSLILEKGFYPAYHMSKTKWVTVVLDECEDEEKVKWLIDMSFDATAAKLKPRRQKELKQERGEKA